MLPKRYVRLISAYVDGELTASQRALALRLLRRSSRARMLYKQLQTNAERLRQLPRHGLTPEFAGEVVQQLAPAATPLAAPAAVEKSAWLSNLVGVALAACILLAVAAASFMLYEPQQAPVASLDDVEHLLPAKDAEELPTGLRFALNDPVLKQELEKDRAFHLKIPCRDNATAVAELKAAFEKNAIRLVVDPALALSKGDCYVFVENLHAEELADILRQQKQFDAVFVNPLTDGDRTALAKRIGVEAESLRAPPPAIDLKKMIAKEGKSYPLAVPAPQLERIAIALAASQTAGAPAMELQQFVQNRRPAPGTLQVLLVLHETRT